MGQKLSYEKRFEIASRLCEALRSLYQDRIVMLSDTRALRLAEDDRDIWLALSAERSAMRWIILF